MSDIMKCQGTTLQDNNFTDDVLGENDIKATTIPWSFQ